MDLAFQLQIQFVCNSRVMFSIPDVFISSNYKQNEFYIIANFYLFCYPQGVAIDFRFRLVIPIPTLTGSTISSSVSSDIVLALLQLWSRQIYDFRNNYSHSVPDILF